MGEVIHSDVVVVGAGIAGLTAATFLVKAGQSVLLLEKESQVGGCINSFKREGFTFDGGIRAIENSGVLLPMLKQLSIEIELVKNTISIGLDNDVVHLPSIANLVDYENLLKRYFPNNSTDIKEIFAAIRKIASYMDVLYSIDNPLFLDLRKDRKYLAKVILPWMFKYLVTIRKIERLKTPVNSYLGRFTANKSLIDMISQHFFKDTPAFFALGYFKIYVDYFYPKGGTKTLPEKIAKSIIGNGGQIINNTEIVTVDPALRHVADNDGNIYRYGKLIWAADLKTLYRIVNSNSIENKKARLKIANQQKAIADKTGGDSVFTLFLGIDLDKTYFSNIASGHFFYTPHLKGLSEIATPDFSSKEDTIRWLGEYFKYNTFEIACPVLRDTNLAPAGKTGLIISTLFDYAITKKIFDGGWYDEFKLLCENMIVDILDSTIYPGIRSKVIFQFSSTPLTFLERLGNSGGAITGWAFTNKEIPAETRLLRIANATKTPIPHVLQAGQWSFSPSGLPISILTGKLAADQVLKRK